MLQSPWLPVVRNEIVFPIENLKFQIKLYSKQHNWNISEKKQTAHRSFPQNHVSFGRPQMMSRIKYINQIFMFSRLFINMGIFVNPEEFKRIRFAISLYMSKYGFTISGGQSSRIFLFDFLCVFLFLNCIQKNRIRLLVQRGRAFLCMFDVRECLADALAAIEIATRSQIFKTTNVLCSARQ